MWAKPAPEGQYIIGCDPSLGRTGQDINDHSSIFVMRRWPGEKREQVAEWYGRILAGDLGNIIDKIGREYNHALINIERNLSDAPLWALLEAGYPTERLFIPKKVRELKLPIEQTYFFNTHKSSKRYLLDIMADYMNSGALVIRSKELLGELRGLQKDALGSVDTGGRDRSMALGMAVIADFECPPDFAESVEPVAEECPPGKDRDLWARRHPPARKLGLLPPDPRR